MNKEKDLIIISVIVLTLWSAYFLYVGGQNKENSEGQYLRNSFYLESCDDLEPNNPYDEGTGHYAGFEWGLDGNDCDGKSQPFIEGCEEYEEQDNAYQSCLDNN